MFAAVTGYPHEVRLSLLAIMEQTELLESNPALKRLIRDRFPTPTPSTTCRSNCGGVAE